MNGSCQAHTHVRLKANYISTRTIKEKPNMQTKQVDQPQYKQIWIFKQKMKLNKSEHR